MISNSKRRNIKRIIAKNFKQHGRRDFDRLTEKVKEQGAGGLIYISTLRILMVK